MKILRNFITKTAFSEKIFEIFSGDLKSTPQI